MRTAWLTLALAVLAIPAACARGGDATAADAPAGTIALTITSSNGAHVFHVEVAKTEAAQARGLMYRTDIPKDGGMLFHPYPPAGGGLREASFWMKNTPSPLDILFIRADRTIARIAENTVPFSETPIPSGEPVAAVLEINGGRAAELGIAEGDKVAWGK
ncbi:conserved exported hypothetical protein [Sphingomonas sp. EC-HK361]|uniref:DUF192 domain-containing protein n=1 Tax=Sphingomonas sp. EC-HK361 TaxID=2038397 RepID=UPI0012545755|nr:DUF192 domain-containing protein [Sphingomonas sp. EC-HK361]VVT04596.1 conserved exported hypothetical protein [Sphingomonas sp. EC-HK361]